FAMRSMRKTSAPRSPSSAPAKGAGPIPPISTMRKPSSGPVKMKSPVAPASAVKAHRVIDPCPIDAGRVGLDVPVLIAKRNAEQQFVARGNSELLANDIGKQAERALRTGRDAARSQRQHQGLRVHADVRRL